MTEQLPPLVVRIRSKTLRRIRTRSRRLMWFNAALGVILGAVFVTIALVNLAGSTFGTAGSLAWILGLATGTIAIAFAANQMRSLTGRRDFWSGTDTGEIAFILGREGAEFFLPSGVDLGLPAGATSVFVTWPSILSISSKKRIVTFAVAPGVLPPTMRDAARYGLPILDQELTTILSAERALRSGVLPAR
jgi:hypothetical protein